MNGYFDFSVSLSRDSSVFLFDSSILRKNFSFYFFVSHVTKRYSNTTMDLFILFKNTFFTFMNQVLLSWIIFSYPTYHSTNAIWSLLMHNNGFCNWIHHQYIIMFPIFFCIYDWWSYERLECIREWYEERKRISYTSCCH